MKEKYTLRKGFRNIKEKGPRAAWKKDVVETAKRYPTVGFAACILKSGFLGNKYDDLKGFYINHYGDLMHKNEEVYSNKLKACKQR